MSVGFLIPDGNSILERDIQTIVALIEHNARWVNPDTFKRLPVWSPHTARGFPLYDASWKRRYTNTRRTTGTTSEKFEGNVAALQALVKALDVASPKPRNWTVCHIWGYDDPSFSEQSKVVQDPRYFSCVANMIWLPTSLKGFTDTLPIIKDMLRVCSYHLYGWACEHPSVAEQAKRVESGWVPEHYPESWPSPLKPGILPSGTAPFSPRIEAEIERHKRLMKASVENLELTYYPRQQVIDVLAAWGVAF